MNPTPTLRAHSVHTLEDRIKILRQLVWSPNGGARDPLLRNLGLQVTRHCPARDDMCELRAIFDFITKNVRYTGDITGKDTFQTAFRTLQFGGGDCFPEGTLVVTRDGFEQIERLEVGDEIHDGQTWVPVMKTWNRGTKIIQRATLDNGNTLRLTRSHTVLRVPTGGTQIDAEEVHFSDVRVGDDLLQPRQFDGAASTEIDADSAFLIGAYLAEGCRTNKKVGRPHNYVSLAGVPGGKGIRERAIRILRERGIHFNERPRDLCFRADQFEESFDLGRTAIDKSLFTFRYGPKSIAEIVNALNADSGMSTTGYNRVYSTISFTLALQYRVLQRMLGQSVGWTKLDDHGGAGSHPIYRLTVRAEATRRPWARIKTLELEDAEVPSFDIMTSSGRVYLPECDVITRQCDDHSVLASTLAIENGFTPKFRITSNHGKTWDHIYAMIGVPKMSPRGWIALDTTLGAGRFNREPPRAKLRDFTVEG